MRRTLIQSVLFASLLILVYYGVQMGMGYFMTLQYVPEAFDNISSVESLQSSVSFGSIARPYSFTVELLGLLVIGMAVFIAGKFLIIRMKGYFTK
ncbi:hypothetical protein ACTHPF_02445 [Paenibacillus sp. SAF-054]|uniref:hypothetical protein n=1 Tax=unclassified Paenibacillus TaxID=185978 RepID=UPI003F7DFDB8